MVLKNKQGSRKQFLIAGSRTIYAFVTKGEKFPSCTTFSDKTCEVKCKPVPNLDSISLGGSRKSAGRVYTGNDCEWIDLNKDTLNEVQKIQKLQHYRSERDI